MPKKKTVHQPPASKRSLSKQEQAIIQTSNDRLNVVDTPLIVSSDDPKSKITFNFDSTLPQQDALSLATSRLYLSMGIKNTAVATTNLFRLGNAITDAELSSTEMAHKFNVAAQTMESLQPKDVIEAQLMSQLIALHEHGMHWLHMAMKNSRSDFINLLLNGASKVLARHHETLEALMRYRRQGKQRVHVEHVHIHQGAQAIVGIVSPQGGSNQNIEEGLHAKV